MSRLVLTEEDYYFAQEEDALPIRWMAVESMHHFRFSLRTDVWSFGVVCFEVFSQAGTPYGDLTPMVLPFKVKEGVRPAQPEGCSSDMYRLMQSCWDASPARRPSFRTIYAKLAELHQVELTQAGVPVRDLGHVLRFIAYGNQSELDTDPYMLEATLARQNASHSDDAGDASSGYSQLTGVHKTYIKASLLALPPLPAAETDTDGMGNLEYFHGAISRQAAERLLMSQGRVAELEGCFLVRNGSSPGDLVLSVVFEGKVRHYRIQQLEDGRYRFYGRDYETVDDLVAEHRTVKNKLMAVLRNHCPREAT